MNPISTVLTSIFHPSTNNSAILTASGDETTKDELEARAAAFSAKEWWSRRKLTLMEISKYNLAAVKDKKTPQLYNPYEGHSYARQLNETVEEFLERLPPATTPVSDLVPWIFIANPYRKIKQATPSQEDVGTEGPPDEGSDQTEFGYRGRGLLKELGGLRKSVEEKNQGKAKIVISRLVNVQRDKIAKDILDTAVKCKFTSGKVCIHCPSLCVIARLILVQWMIFAATDEVNAKWRIIAKATAQNELGTVAKVAPDDGVARKERLICIYTYDFTDVGDVTRVAKKLKELQLIDSRGRGIFYKCGRYCLISDAGRS